MGEEDEKKIKERETECKNREEYKLATMYIQCFASKL